MKNTKTAAIAIVAVGAVSAGILYGGIALLGNASASPHVAAAAVAGGETAPDFTLEKLGGGAISLSQFRGKKPVILDFFATWCPNCRRDIPHENAFYETYKDRVELIGVNLQENPATVAKFASELRIPFPVALDPNGAVSNAYGVRYTNYHVLIDKNGVIAGVIPGDIREADFQQLAAL